MITKPKDNYFRTIRVEGIWQAYGLYMGLPFWARSESRRIAKKMAAAAMKRIATTTKIIENGKCKAWGV